MKRVLFAIVGTIAGLVGLLSFKSHSPALGSTVSQSLSTGRPHHHPLPGPRHPSRHPAASKSSQPSQSGSATKKVLGPAVQTPYGVVQVSVTVGGGRIEHVGLARLTAFDSTSQMINSQAAPILVHETMAAQSSHINMVSGATYTSEGYLQSLQRALDQVGMH